MRGSPAEAELESAGGRRAEDHLPDRRRHVEEVADAGGEAGVVKGECALEADLLLGREEQLDAGVCAVLVAEPAGGFVGKLSVTPQGGPAGTHVTVSGETFAPEQEFDLVWRTVKGRWKVTVAEYHGREFAPVGYRIATARSDKAGHIAASFIAPADFGFQHDIMVQQGNRLLTQTAFNVEMTVKLAEDKGPLGSPIAIEVQGIGWRELERHARAP